MSTISKSLPMTEREVPTMDSSLCHSSSLHSSSSKEDIPIDKIRVTLLLVSGQRHTFDFNPSTTIEDVKMLVYNQWPEEWTESLPTSIKNVELVYLGKFLDNNTKLKDNGFLGGQSTIFHLIIRKYTKKSNEDSKNQESVSWCKCCIIM
ncbi:unnamed protein product [Cunninghamella blakesleeana]